MSVFESYWANKAACDDAERAYYEKLSGCKVTISLYLPPFCYNPLAFYFPFPPYSIGGVLFLSHNRSFEEIYLTW